MRPDRATQACVIIVRRRLAADLRRWLFPIGIVALVALSAAHLATDTDWDLRNYHAYNAHALISGRFWTDIAAAQLQTFYPPFMDIAVGAVRDRLDATPVLRNVVLSLPQGIAVALAFVLTLRFTPPALPARRPLAFLATLFSAAGAAGWPTLASAMSEMLPGACIIGGLLLLTADSTRPTRSAAMAGLLFGTAAGLKLTGLPYCVGATVALLLVPARPPAKRPATLAAFCLGGAAAAALLVGPWWLLLYRNFGNPVLPFFNQYLHSPFVESIAISDTRFLPADLVMALAYPFYWGTQAVTLVSEMLLRDPRIAMLYVALIALAVQALRRRPGTTDRRVILLAVFCVATFAAWEVQFSILRYLATLELLTGAMMLAALRPLLAQPGVRLRVALAFIALCGAAQAVTLYPDWGRTAAPLPMRANLPVAVQPDAMVVLLDGAPMAYLADLLPLSVRLVGANNNLVQPGRGGLLEQQATMAIRGQTGPLYGLEDPVEAPGVADRTLAYYRLGRGDCARVESNLDNDAVHMCRLWPAR